MEQELLIALAAPTTSQRSKVVVYSERGLQSSTTGPSCGKTGQSKGVVYVSEDTFFGLQKTSSTMSV